MSLYFFPEAEPLSEGTDSDDLESLTDDDENDGAYCPRCDLPLFDGSCDRCGWSASLEAFGCDEST